MKLIAITQRVEMLAERNERRDALDQKWHAFLRECGLQALLLPNDPQTVGALLLTYRPGGVILSGGNDLARFKGGVPERDATEQAAITYALESRLPVIGVCRGMQFLADHYGSIIEAVPNHAGTRHAVYFPGGAKREVNSYHHYGVRSLAGGLEMRGRAEDSSIEAMSHENGLVHGIMWHPEREENFDVSDLAMFRDIFSAGV